MNKTHFFRISKKVFPFFILFFILSSSINSYAQHSTSSPYSRFGIGDISSRGNSQTYGLGGVSAAVRSSFSLNSVNPASYTGLLANTFLLDLGINYKSSAFVVDGQNQYNNDANISHFAFAFSAKNWLYFSAGIKPTSYVGYNIEHTYTLADQTQSLVSYSGQGGINKVYMGTAVHLFKRLSIGLNVNYNFGTLQKTSSAYLPTDGGSTVVDATESNVFKKFTPDFGIQYTDSIFGESVFTLGVVYNQQAKYNTYTELLTKRFLSINGNSYNDTIQHVETPEGTITIPASFGVGFAVNFKNKFLIAADYYQQDWTNAGIENIGDFSLTKEYTASAGLEFIPKLGGNKLHQNIRYRVGGYFKNSYLQANDQNINVSALTVGIGFPFKGNSNILNMAFELGKRGTQENSLLQENFALFSLSFSLHDYWFRKFKYN